MVETIEIRVPETHAEKHLPEEAGTRLGMVRKLALRPDDPLLTEVGRLDREFRSRGRAFFTSWIPHRRYSARELAEAEVLKVSAKQVFEPAGEECGTEYDESTACPECGSGATQRSELRLDLRRTPRGVDFAETIAGERIVTQRFAECLTDAGLKGFTLARVLHEGHSKGGSQHHGVPPPVWYQLVANSPVVELSPLTRAGADPFDDNSTGRCSRGHIVGLNLLSEVTVIRRSLPEADVMETKQMIGVRRGLLRPRPVLLLSSEAWKAIEGGKIKGFTVEVARIS